MPTGFKERDKFTQFDELCASIPSSLSVESAVLDGEIVRLDEAGRAVFNKLMFRRSDCFFYAFGVLVVNGKDLRTLPLIERKRRLRKLIPRAPARLLYVDHLEACGCALFKAACSFDLEGIVAKRKDSQYRVTEKPSRDWIKIKNPAYSQAEGRHELFERSAPAMTGISQ